MNRLTKVSWLLLISAIAFVSLGTIAKRKDPIELTQTDPASAKEKLKEEAEGKKGPPAPTLELFPKERFLSEGPVEKEKEEVEEEEWVSGEEENLDFWFGEESEEGKDGEEGEEELLWEEESDEERVKADEQTDDTWEDL